MDLLPYCSGCFLAWRPTNKFTSRGPAYSPFSVPPFLEGKGARGIGQAVAPQPFPFPPARKIVADCGYFSWPAGKADLIFYLRPNPLTPFPKWEGGIYRRERVAMSDLARRS